MLMADYVRRFGRSIYARKLFRAFAEAVAKRDEPDSGELVEELVAATPGAEKKAKIQLFLNIAEHALPRGKIILAKAAASEVLSLKPDSAEDTERAMLYRAAAEAPTAHAPEALKALNQLTAERLSDDDAEIHNAASFIASAISETEITDAATHHETADDTARDGTLTKSLMLPRVASAVENADVALKKADTIISGNMK
jgi:chemotaxis protein MotC